MSTASGPRVQLGIQRCVHAEALREQVGLGKVVEQMILDHVHKVGRRAALQPAANHMQRNFFRVGSLVRGNHRVFRHGQKRAVSRFDGALRAAFRRRVTIRGVDNAGQERRFRERKFADILIEVGERGFAESVNRKAAAIPQVDLVGVQLKNLLLREAMLQFQRHHGLGNLAPSVRSEMKKNFARPAWTSCWRPEHALRGASPPTPRPESARVKSGMLEETAVFHRKHGIPQYLRDIVVADRAAFFT